MHTVNYLLFLVKVYCRINIFHLYFLISTYLHITFESCSYIHFIANMFVKCLVVVLFSTFISTFAKDDLHNHQYRGHILKNKGNYETVITLADFYEAPSDYTDDVIATGAFNQTYNVTGWSILQIKTSENFSNIEQAYAAGLLEGQFTHGTILFFLFIFNYTCWIL